MYKEGEPFWVPRGGLTALLQMAQKFPHKPMNPNKPYFTDYEAKQTFYTEYASVFVRSK